MKTNTALSCKLNHLARLSLAALVLTVSSAGVILAQDKKEEKKPEIPVAAQVVSDTKEYTLKRVYAKGDIDLFKYIVKAHTTIAELGGEVDIKLGLLVKETTLEVKDSGETKILMEMPEAKADFSGTEMDIADFLPKFTSTKTKDGVRDVKVEGGRDGIQEQLGDLFRSMEEVQGAFFPTKPVKIGDSWKVSKETKEGDKTSKSDMTVKFAAVEEIEGVKTLRLEAKGDSSINKDKLSQDSVVNYNAITGKLVKAKLKIEGTSNGSPLKLDVSISEQPKEKDKKAN